MKKYYRQAIAFLLVWFCSGVTMYSYQAENKILGITFTLLSFFIGSLQTKMNRRIST